MKVTITIKGQCIVYFKDKVWNVVFITDKCHEAYLLHWPQQDGDAPDGPLKNEAFPQVITFAASTLDSATPPSNGDLDDLLNLSASYLHGMVKDASGRDRSKLTVDPHPGKGRQSIHMKVPYGILAVDPIKPGSPDYFIEIDGSNLPQSLGRQLASGVQITFDVDDGSKLSMDIAAGATSDTRTYIVNEPLTLGFDNDCRNPAPTGNDFLNIYDWVKDEYEKDLRYVAGKLHVVKKEEHPEKMLIFGPTGDCDPVVIDPPPGP